MAMAYIVVAYTVMAYMVMACTGRGERHLPECESRSRVEQRLTVVCRNSRKAKVECRRVDVPDIDCPHRAVALCVRVHDAVRFAEAAGVHAVVGVDVVKLQVVVLVPRAIGLRRVESERLLSELCWMLWKEVSSCFWRHNDLNRRSEEEEEMSAVDDDDDVKLGWVCQPKL